MLMKSHTDVKKAEFVKNYRKKFRGLIGVKSKVPVRDSAALSSVYTPGVGEVCLEVQKDIESSYDLTFRGNTIAIISDGTSVFDLGNIGPYAVLPALEVKSVFYKSFAGIDAMPLPLNTNDIDEMVKIIRLLQPTFGGFQLEKISSPRCFELKQKLEEALSLPFVNADLEGMGIAVLSALINAVEVVNKKLNTLSVVINTTGPAGFAVAKVLHQAGVERIIVCDKHGAIYTGRQECMDWVKEDLAKYTNINKMAGDLKKVISSADAFIGISSADSLTPDMIKSMADDPIIFALGLPEPEISYDAAKEAGAKVVATRLANKPNQILSTVPLGGLFRALLDTRTKKITPEMLKVAAEAMAKQVPLDKLNSENVVPDPLHCNTTATIAKEVARVAISSGLSKGKMTPEQIEQKVLDHVYFGAENTWVEAPTSHELADTTSIKEKSIEMHRRHNGVIEIKPKVTIRDKYIYDMLFSPDGTAEICREIQQNPDKIYEYTCKNNMAAVVTDGTAVLGLGDIGPTSGLPVMEGKAVLFKTLGGVEAYPICVDTKDIEEIVRIVQVIEPVFGGVNLEDIAAPSCFSIEEKLKKTTSIPIFHDDQHGTAVVTLAGLINALKYANRRMDEVKVVMNGAGAGSIAVCNLLLSAGFKHIIMCDTKGAIYKGRPVGMNPYKDAIAEVTNLEGKQGLLEEVIKGTDVFIGLSKGNTMTQEMIRSMNPDPIIFALANPYPEIMPDLAYEAGAKIVATGRSDFPNQVNNSIAFPGIFRGALDVRAREITDDMKTAAAHALAGLITPKMLGPTCILPSGLDLSAPVVVSRAVAKTAIETGMARVKVDPTYISDNLKTHLNEYNELRPAF